MILLCWTIETTLILLQIFKILLKGKKEEYYKVPSAGSL